MIVSPSNRIEKIETYYFAKKLAQIADMNMRGMDVLNLGIGSPDLEPPSEVLECLGRLISEKGLNGYQSYKGIPELRNAFADHYSRIFKVELSPETEILPLLGSKEGIMHLSMSFLNPGDKVLVPNPGYLAYRSCAKLAGAEILEYSLEESNDYHPDLAEIEKNDLSKVKIMWLNYPQMPTGARADRRLFEKLIVFAKKHSILLCLDNPYSGILEDNPESILSVPQAKAVALELTSLSKKFNMAGWRVGALLGASDYIEEVLKFKSNMDSGMYKPIQLAAASALNMDSDWGVKLNQVYRRRRSIVWDILDMLGCTYKKDSAGMFVWAKVPSHVSCEETWVEELLNQASVFITPGFIFGSQGKGHIRVSLCSEEAILTQAFQRIEKFVTVQVT